MIKMLIDINDVRKRILPNPTMEDVIKKFNEKILKNKDEFACDIVVPNKLYPEWKLFRLWVCPFHYFEIDDVAGGFGLITIYNQLERLVIYEFSPYQALAFIDKFVDLVRARKNMEFFEQITSKQKESLHQEKVDNDKQINEWLYYERNEDKAVFICDMHSANLYLNHPDIIKEILFKISVHKVLTKKEVDCINELFVRYKNKETNGGKLR